MGKIWRDLAHVVREKNWEQGARTLNSYANEAGSCMARSVADKFSKREDMFFLLRILYGNFGEIPPFTDNTKGKKMLQKEGEETGILFIVVRGMWGIISGVGGWCKNYILLS